MRKIIVLLAVLELWSFQIRGQSDPNAQNIVPNPGFELENPDGTNPGCQAYYSGSEFSTNGHDRFNSDVPWWDVADKNPNLPNFGSPDWEGSSTECNDFNSTYPGNNTRYVHMATDIESIYTQLIKDGNPYYLIPGKKYIMKYKHLRYSNQGKVEILFTKWGVHWNSLSSNNKKWVAHDATLSWSGGSSSWVQEVRSFVVPTGSDYSELGNLVLHIVDESGSNITKVLMDDIEIYEETTCPWIRAIENTNYWAQSKILQAANTLRAGYDVANPLTANGNVIVGYNSKIIYRAGNAVSLEPGFNTDFGAYFLAVIEPCEGNPCPMPPSLEGNYFVSCAGAPINIGDATTETGLIYTWSPSTYLDSPGSPNPLFTPPATGNGTVTYNVSISTICSYFGGVPFYGDEVNSQVTVVYINSPNPTPFVDITSFTGNEHDFTLNATLATGTEEVCIEFLEGTSVIAQHCLKNPMDFFGTSLSFNYQDIPESIRMTLSNCKQYTVRLKSKNYCSSAIAIDDVFWARNTALDMVLVPNVISPPDFGETGDGVNDFFCIQTKGADNYNLVVKNNWGMTVHSSFGAITQFEECIWDGHCTTGICSGENLSPGVYFIVLKIWNDCDEEKNEEDEETYTGTVEIFDDAGRAAPTQQDNGDQTVESQETKTSPYEDVRELKIFPNPTSSKIYVSISEVMGEQTVQLFNNLGQLVCEKKGQSSSIEISTNEYSNGMYTLKYKDKGLSKTTKIVINH